VTGAVQLVNVSLRGDDHGVVRVALASVIFAIPLQRVAAVEGTNRIHDLDQFFIWTLPPVWGRSV
jgi:hypothetical protein